MPASRTLAQAVRGNAAHAAAPPEAGPGVAGAGAIRFAAVSQSYGDNRVIDSLSFDIGSGEFFSILGPSGSGKTTCLRLIAGFERPTAGSVILGGVDVTTVPPYARDVNTVFQDYALFPHLSVLGNVEYGLRMKGVDPVQRKARALEALDMVELGNLHERSPTQLSGGQRQRVALARALVNRPSVLLLDEPLGALDLRLREQMQVELKKLHRHLGVTFVYVTHDQGEAMSMSDRIAVLVGGRIDQLATPRELYLNPATAFVAEFVGTSNVLRGALAAAVGALTPLVSVRPENIVVRALHEAVPDSHVALRGILTDVQFHGATNRYKINVDGAILTAIANNAVGVGGASAAVFATGESGAADVPSVGTPVRISWASSSMVFLAS
jgi:putative spermidine/putrescine transport system ATP-binding protein